MNNIQMNNGNAGIGSLLELFSQQGKSDMPQVFIPPVSSEKQSGFQDILNKASFEKPNESRRRNDDFFSRKEDFSLRKQQSRKEEKVYERENKTFSLKRNDKKEIPRSTVEEKSKSEVEETVKDNKKEEKKEQYLDKDQGSVLQVIANVLEISMQDLMKTMKDANIEPKEFIKEFDFQEIKSLLEELAPIDEKDTAFVDKMLIKLLAQASNEKTSESVDVESRMMDKLLQGNLIKEETSEFPELEGLMKENQEGGNEKLKEVAEIMRFLGHKIKEFKENLLSSNEEQATEVSQSIEEESGIEVYGKKLLDSEGEGELFQENASSEELDLKDNKQSHNNAKQALNNATSEKSQNFNGIKEKGSNTQVKSNEASNINGIINSSEASKLNRSSSVTKTSFGQQTFKETILKQIVSSAKVTLSNGKSEMKLELRPEHLGKLSLKIVTEQGKVMAKIFADSYQVKEIIETNLNTLKDSLESQGVKVEGFTVDVGQNKERQFKERNHNVHQDKKGRGNGKENLDIKGISTTNYGGYEHHEDRLNRYYGWEEEGINLTA